MIVFLFAFIDIKPHFDCVLRGDGKILMNLATCVK